MSRFSWRQQKALILTSLGGVLEFYDFIIYIFLAPTIEKIFFSDSSAYIATLKTLAIFSIGYLLRPIGGIIFSHFGDRYGRKVVFLATVILMALPSFCIGLLPLPAQIGIAAPLLLLLFRVMQGLALGGEIPAAITFVYEHAHPSKRGISLAVLFLGINAGLLLGSFIITLLSVIWSEQAILSYAWRFPFILGGIFGVIALYLRRHLHETQAFLSLPSAQLSKIPVITLLKTSYQQVILGVFLVATGSVTVFLYLYWPQYLTQYFHYDFATLMKINTLGTLMLSVTILLGGRVADKIGYAKTYFFVLTALLVFTYPLFYLFQFHNLILLSLSYFCFSLMFGFIPAAYSSLLSGLFDTRIRYSGVALSYNLAYALFGGLSPILCTIAIHWFNLVIAPAFYVMTIVLLSGAACILVSFNKTKKPITVIA